MVLCIAYCEGGCYYGMASESGTEYRYRGLGRASWNGCMELLGWKRMGFGI
jgi:hypothetical protein